MADIANHRVCVFSADGSQLVRSWGTKGTRRGQFRLPTALAVAGSHLYVLDGDSASARVQVFECWDLLSSTRGHQLASSLM